MRKSFFLAPILTLLVAALIFVISGSSQSMGGDGLYQTGPETCPEGGCAAGQRLNFTIEFTANTGDGICFYAPTDFVDSGSLTINLTGALSSEAYELNNATMTSLCDEKTEAGETLLASASVPADVSPDQIKFSFTINAATTSDFGIVVARTIEPDSGTSILIDTFTSDEIEVAELISTVYTADTPDDCSSHSPCFVNTLEDEADGLGTGLRDAIRAISPGGTIRVLGNYPIKDNTILIDKAIVLSGYSDSTLTYTGSNCDSPMLSITTGATVTDLNINDGACTSPSRTLIQVNSISTVQIEHNTLTDGKYAVEVKNNTGDVLIYFNEILDNDGYGVLHSSGESSGEMRVYANNIIGNGSVSQALCDSIGNVDHNYWGENESAEDNVELCAVSDGKQLGAPILESSNAPGVEAVLKSVTSSKSYAFNSKIAVSHTGGSDYDLIIVNHGQGSDENIPFFDVVGDSINPCSNFFDVFTLDNTAPSDLALSIKYDLNDTCLAAIETSEYCTGADSADYPLWWYDPANDVTDGWDTVGQDPEGPGAGSASGQTVVCNTSTNEIQVTIDNTGRPGLSNDLSYTPFFTGYVSQSGIELSLFKADFDVTQDVLTWTTTEERNIKGFHILRADSQSGPFARISPLIEAIGDTYIGGIYTYTDANIVFTKTYYYKLEVIDNNGTSIETYGPVSVLTSTATPTTTPTRTATITRTPSPTRTSTTYIYRSPTSYYRPATSTPRSLPTQVRTYRPTSTATSGTKPTYNATTQSASSTEEGYPVGTDVSIITQSYPLPDSVIGATPTPTPQDSSAYPADRDSEGEEETTSEEEETSPNNPESVSEIRWIFLALGGFGGLLLLAVIGTVLVKTRLS